MDITTAANRLGIKTADVDPAQVRDDLASLLLTLERDVDADQDIQDGHDRFGEHVAAMGLAGDLDPGFDAKLDTMSWDNLTEANAVERQGIALVRARFL